MAAPLFSAAAKIVSIQASARQGRAASWTQTKSACGLHPGQRGLDRIAPLRPAVDHLDPQNGDVGGKLQHEIGPVLGRDHQDRLHHVVAAQKPLGRVQPDGLVGQRRERLLIAAVVEPAAAAGGGQNHGELAHGGVSLGTSPLIVRFRGGASRRNRPCGNAWPANYDLDSRSKMCHPNSFPTLSSYPNIAPQ